MSDGKPKLAWGRLYAGTRHHRKLRILRQRCPESWWIFYPLLEMAFEANDGGVIYLDPDIPFSSSELAIEVGLSSVDLLEATLKSMEDLKLVALENGFVRFLSYNERQFQSDLSAERTRKYREKLKNQSPKQECDSVVTSPKQECNDAVAPLPPECNAAVTAHNRYGNGEVTPPEAEAEAETDTDTENRKVKVEDAPSPPQPPGGGNGEARPQPQAFFSCPHFEIDQEFFDALLRDFRGLNPDILHREIRKAADWITDNPGRHKRRAKTGFIANPRSFLRRWLEKVETRAGPVNLECSQPGIAAWLRNQGGVEHGA